MGQVGEETRTSQPMGTQPILPRKIRLGGELSQRTKVPRYQPTVEKARPMGEAVVTRHINLQ